MHFSENGRSEMRKFVTTKLIWIAALLVLTGGPVAIAQTGGTTRLPTPNPAAPPPPEAPIRHRQPRAHQVPSEKNPTDPNHPLSKENAALDKKIKSICR